MLAVAAVCGIAFVAKQFVMEHPGPSLQSRSSAQRPSRPGTAATRLSFTQIKLGHCDTQSETRCQLSGDAGSDVRTVVLDREDAKHRCPAGQD